MKLFRKKASKWQQAYTGTVGNAIRSVGNKIDEKFHTRKKVETMNQWASDHPKKFFRFTLIAGFGILLLGVIPSLFSIADKDPLKLEEATEEIHRTSSLLDGMRRIESRKSVEQNLAQELAGEVMAMKREVDSLAALPQLTHDDSLRLAVNLKKLRIISNNIKPNEKD